MFDEADRLFEMGFEDQLKEVLRRMTDRSAKHNPHPTPSTEPLPHGECSSAADTDELAVGSIITNMPDTDGLVVGSRASQPIRKILLLDS